MADKRIVDLDPVVLPLVGDELVPLWQGGITKQVPVSEIGFGGGGSSGLVAYDVAGRLDGQYDALEVILHFIAVRDFYFPAGMTGSRAFSSAPATGNRAFTCRKNNTQFGTMTFEGGQSVAVFAANSQTPFVAGDRLSVVAPITTDETLANLVFTLAGLRNS
jgi:hypothetical protein